ncbi:unnamed protein product [Dicrocoelium dendriticum]|nr:unnamed protein product [Dicrocoelium dendriticum]
MCVYLENVITDTHPLYPERVLELNASDERGIEVIRQKVKAFAHLAVSSGARSAANNIPPYKLVILDEADSMTAPAQAALRRTMETETRTTRFCLTCNYVTRIIDPITSRCAKFRFRPLDNDVSRARLRYVCDAEGLFVEDDVLDYTLLLSGGDLRRGITMLQSAYQLYHPSDGVRISKEHLDEVASVIPTQLLLDLVEVARKGRFDEMQSKVKDLLFKGHSAHQVILQLHNLAIQSNTLSDKQKGPLLEELAVSFPFVYIFTHSFPSMILYLHKPCSSLSVARSNIVSILCILLRNTASICFLLVHMLL